ncbi:MAG: phosphatidylglycerol lysyltransferase domain-containing protein [Deltaproteobacteria bacterium]|nr:phosphatidylglycerol lysyltransferase domain-containing protein [Deltaproteobacteria bacterium]
MLQDRERIAEILISYRPTTSEWTFTNLFMWRKSYGLKWSLLENVLFIISERNETEIYGFQPIGCESKYDVITLLEWLKEEKKQVIPRIERVDKRFISLASEIRGISISPMREHFDYVYLREDLVQLRGKRYRAQRNHISKALRSYPFEFQILNNEHIKGCLEVHKKWCEIKECDQNESLLAELRAVNEVFTFYDILNLIGGVITLWGQVVAFTFGEMLNDETMVVHVEKADPRFPYLYSLINQKFCEVCAKNAIYINREQDLGIPGLRNAKMSYHPNHMEEKYLVEARW